MEVIKRLSDVDPEDLAVIAHVFGQDLGATAGALLILKTPNVSSDVTIDEGNGLPDWCNVMDGMSDEDLAELRQLVELPVYLARRAEGDGP